MYNAEKYITQCLHSILAQTFINFEVIVVDDCSTDNSYNIVSDMSSKFNGRLKLIKLGYNSGGAGIPRNVGIRMSRGKYISFIDNDDLFTNTAIEELYKIAEETQADVLHAEKFLTNKDSSEIINKNTPLIIRSWEFGGFVDKVTVETDNFVERMQMYCNRRFFWYVWNKLFRRDFLVENQIEFPNMIVSDDMVFSFKCLCLAKKYVRIPNAFNIYRNRNDSVSRQVLSVEKYIHQNLSTIVKGIEVIDNFMDTIEIVRKNPEIKTQIINFFIHEHLNYFKNIYANNPISAVDPYIRKEFLNGNTVALSAHLFGLVNVYSLKLMQIQQKIK